MRNEQGAKTPAIGVQVETCAKSAPFCTQPTPGSVAEKGGNRDDSDAKPDQRSSIATKQHSCEVVDLRNEEVLENDVDVEVGCIYLGMYGFHSTAPRQVYVRVSGGADQCLALTLNQEPSVVEVIPVDHITNIM
jgi:hypothetical protein